MKENLILSLSFEFSKDAVYLYLQLTELKDFVLSKQLLRCATSVGANVEEAMAAQSRKDFAAKLSIAAKEAREANYWLRLMKETS
jgi:four helix bundle protein